MGLRSIAKAIGWTAALPLFALALIGVGLWLYALALAAGGLVGLH